MTETTLKNTKVEENEGNIAADTKPAKPYEFRTLNATDVFPMLSIISKIGVNEFTACFEKEEVTNVIKSLAGKGKNKEQITSIVGVTMFLEIANVILGNLPKCEKDIYHLLSSTSNLTEVEVKSLSMPDFFVMIIDFIKKEEFADFIKVVSEFLK